MILKNRVQTRVILNLLIKLKIKIIHNNLKKVSPKINLKRKREWNNCEDVNLIQNYINKVLKLSLFEVRALKNLKKY